MHQAIRSDLGVQMRRARLRQGSTVAQIAVRIGVAPRYLRALEWDRPDLLPDDKTARTVLRDYAGKLGLDADASLRGYEASLAALDPPAREPEPRRRRFLDRQGTPFLVVLAPAVAAVALVLLLDRVDRSGSEERTPAARPPLRAAVLVPPSAPVRREAGTQGVARARPEPGRRAAPRVAELELTASGGDSWLVVRKGSARGPVIFEGLLEQGQSLDFARPRVWIRLGAASNVRVRVNGQEPPFALFGTLDAVVDPHGLRKVPSSP